MRTSRKISLPEADRNELERLVRARSTPQKVVLRANIVLLSSAGVSTGEIKERLQTTTPTISRWRHRYEVAGVPGLLKDASRPGRKPGLRQAPGAWAAAAPGADVQALPRPAVGGEAPGCGRALRCSAQEGDGLLRGREKPDSGARPHPAEATDETGAGGDDDARLQAQRHHNALRRPQRAHRRRHWGVHAAPPPRGVSRLPEEDRPGDPGGPGSPPDRGQPRDPQAQGRRKLAHPAPALPSPLHADLGFLAQPRAAF